MPKSKRLVVTAAEAMTEHQQRIIGRQNITRDDCAELVTATYGPLAAFVKEIATRQMLIEDSLGMQFVPEEKYLSGKTKTPAHFIQVEPSVGKPAQCARCGRLLETDAELLTMICEGECSPLAEEAADGEAEPVPGLGG